MIKRLHVQNFKSLKDIKMELKPLNLLMGLNGMGKSSVIQSMLILRQSRDLSKGFISLSDYMVEIGKGKDAMYQYTQDEHIKIVVDFSEQPTLGWTLKYNQESNHLQSEEKYDTNLLNGYSLFGRNFQYLKAERAGPRVDYKTSYAEVINDRQVGIDGYYAIHFLNAFGNEKIKQAGLLHPKAKSETLMHQVDAWLGEITPGVKLNTTEIPGTDKVVLDFQFETGSLYTNRFRPANVGFGLTYSLPVIITLLSIKNDKLIILENPESHIHPRGQAELGKLIALAAKNGAQLIVETHSDHILNGIRVAVKKGLIGKDDVGIFYFEKDTSNEEQFSRYTNIKVDDKGELSEYPPKFLDEWSNQLLQLL
jgi:predicted ATPase